ncbi:MFS general substrate transporter [Astrocystis sublimbata]|nr:MFS general substrate transporter [Astrocystis sublimbata]
MDRSTTPDPSRRNHDFIANEGNMDTNVKQPAKKSSAFWGIVFSMQLISILSALDTTVVSTAMPSILKDVGASEAWVWIANAYFLTMTAFQPFFGQAANVFGRRSMTLLATLIFGVGSAICGAAPSLAVLIAGRAIQGIGSGAISILIEINIADLLPLRERPKYMGIVLIGYTVAAWLGPIIGGLFAQRATWRWIFYLNLPITGVALVCLWVFLRTKHQPDTVRNSIKRVDLGGNALLVASVVAVLLALTWGGTQYPWSAYQTLVPLILGILGIAAFIALESTTLIPEPTMPLRLFSNRTSLGAFGVASIHALLTNFTVYFLPVYFQSVLATGPIISGVNLLPLPIITMPFAILAGIGTTKYGRYRPFFFVGTAFLALSYGLLTRLDEHTTTAYWAGVEAIAAVGLGLLTTTTWPAVQAPLEEVDQAVSTAAWGFVRSFGYVWGVAIPGAIFNSRVNDLSSAIPDPDVRASLVNGGAYELAATGGGASTQNWSPEIKAQVTDIYVESLRRCWQVGIGFALLGFVISFVLKDIPLRDELDTEYGLKGTSATVSDHSNQEEAIAGSSSEKTESKMV